MSNMKIAVHENAIDAIRPVLEQLQHEVVVLGDVDIVDVAALVVSTYEREQDVKQLLKGLDIPVFVAGEATESAPTFVAGIIDTAVQTGQYYARQLDEAATKYEKNLMPAFFGLLKQYVEMGNSTFACPGHQGGQFFKKHPVGKQMFDFFGENVFRGDMCNADVKLGDLLIHEGAAHEAQANAAKVYNADKTYFVLNGTSASNKVVCNALLTQGDLVLFDRNNHKSNHHGALIQAGATPVYLETARNPFGFIGGIDDHCFEEAELRAKVAAADPSKATAERPFRLAIIQLGTYDGTIYNARQVVDRIGHLCDYILFDSAWVGYEQFIPMMKDCSPLLLDLKETDPGIIVTQSVHKQQAGFSQTSQIHKKDKHIKGQARYCNHKRFNNAFMMHASTSPFYALFSSLDVNAKMHEGEFGKRMWVDAVKTGIEARKQILNKCTMMRPFVPPMVNGKKWEDGKTEEMAQNLEYFQFEPGAKWHSFDGYGDHQYFVDPMKLLLTTPGIDVQTGEYEEFGIPATILANYLRENGIIPEKCDLNSILFLLTPAEDTAKMNQLVSKIAQFEQLVAADAPLKVVLPTVYAKYEQRYAGYTIRQLCQEMHDLYKTRQVNTLQKRMFREEFLPEFAMNPQEAHVEFIRGNVELVPLAEIKGRIAAEGALPYPPGVLVTVPGERWSETSANYFLALEDGINNIPGFAPELQGVYLQDVDGRTCAFGYVLTENK